MAIKVKPKQKSLLTFFGIFVLTLGVSGCSSEPTSDEILNDFSGDYQQCIQDTRKLRDMDMVVGGFSDADIAEYCLG